MAEATTTAAEAPQLPDWRPPNAYEKWVEDQGVPIHRGYYVQDLRTLELGWWEERQCNAAFLLLAGQEGVSEVRVTEVPPAATLPPLKMGVDEAIYVAEGRGMTTVWATEGGPKKTFEWQKHSMFHIPRHHTYQLSSLQGSTPARLMHTNYLPLASQAVPDLGLFINNSLMNVELAETPEGEMYAHATAFRDVPGLRGGVYWHGNFFPNMRAWDDLVPFKGRGAGGHVVWVRFPNSPITAHMSVFPSHTYKKAHRHGPAYVIVIPAGEGFSVMWPEGKEKVIIPWQEASVFVPPNRWFHQHFNLGQVQARYLAMHPPRGLATGANEQIADPARDQIDYANEEPWIRERFESELAKRGMTSDIPEAAYKDKNYEWAYEGE